MRRPRCGDDRGAVVAEFAVALPAIVVVVLLAVGALSTTGQHIRLQDAAADAARLAARGESDGRVAAAVAAAVTDATATVTGDGEVVCVTASTDVLAGLRIAATGCALAGGR